MSGSLGDIVVTLGLDSRKWFDEASKIGQSVKGIGGQIHSTLSRDVLSGGLGGGLSGAISPVTSALDSYLSKFGSFGAVAGVVASAGIATAVASLTSQKDAFDDITQSLESVNRGMDAYLERQAKITSFNAGLAKITSGAGLDTSIRDIDARIAGAREADAGLLKHEAAINTELRKADDARKAADMGPAATWLARTLGFDVPEDAIKTKIADLERDLGRVTGRRIENAKDLNLLMEQRNRLVEERPAVDVRAAEEDARRIREADPRLSAQAEMERISRAVSQGGLDRAVGVSAAQRIYADFVQRATPNVAALRNEGVAGGTASGFSALQDTIRESQTKVEAADQKVISLLERMLEALKGQDI